jgi:oligopeptide/dipeptide ABC transporter ATP-binding protein
MQRDAILGVTELSKSFSGRGGFAFGQRPKPLRAVVRVSFEVLQGETLAIIGESGCGKTTTLKLLLLIEQPDFGVATFKGKNIFAFNSTEQKAYRRAVQAVFQDPYSSLSPRMRVGDIVGEPLQSMESLARKQLTDNVVELMERVGLPRDAAARYPHEFSGGQRQRIAIARALSIKPNLIVLDEPVSALDISIRAQIVNLLQDIQQAQGVSFLLVSHDLPIVRHMSHRTAVMYLGHLVEIATTAELYARPQHPYTRALLSSALPTHPKYRRTERVSASDAGAPTIGAMGCPYLASCPLAFDRCRQDNPTLRETAAGHRVACHIDS